MSNRDDITDGLFATTSKSGLIYTQKLGWVDLGHTQGNDARALKAKLDNESFASYFEEFNEWYFPVSYHQEMGRSGRILGKKVSFQTGVSTQVMVKACLSPEVKARVALTIMYSTAKRFEAWQNSILFNWHTDSGFSAEDLVSDLVGFYRVFGKGPDPLWLAEPVPYETALQIWDSYDPIGHYKNTEFSPFLFPTEPPIKYGQPLAAYAWFTLTSGHHHYTRDNTLAFWLYTPDSLKNLPTISNHGVYSYNFNPDTQQTRVTITWSGIENFAEKKKELSNFIQMFNSLNKYNCAWIYNDKNNYSENYQRYCISQKEETLELEFFEA